MSSRSAVALCGALLAPSATSAAAQTARPLGLSNCVATQGVRQCSGLVATWDGIPLDTTVTLPSSASGDLPLVADIHGFGNSKYEYLDPSSTAYTDNAFAWARDGYAVLTYTARGLWGSCGTPEARFANPLACARGYIHLADVRYEARDTQELIGRLVDEGVADPARLGVTGDSYGGGQSFELAALRDRTMLPDGRLVPWRSPKGKPLSLAAAAPVIPWTDLVYTSSPNGRTRANTISAPGAESTPVGVFKASFGNAILAAAQFAIGPGQPLGEPFVPGRPMGFLSVPGSDPDADVVSDVARADAGEPYTDPPALAIVERQQRYRSAYHIDSTHAPPPLFVGSGFTDDLFPVDEALRFVNRTRRDHPGTPISLLFGDFGHQRASNKPADRKLLLAAIHAWFDHYVKGGAPAPANDVTAVVQTCPRDAPSGATYTAPTFAALAQGVVRYQSAPSQTLLSTGGSPAVALALDPAAGGGDACAITSAAPEANTATYLLPAAPAGGYTLLGAPAVEAKLTVSGTEATSAQIAARLWDVAPGSATQTLVARGLYRPSGGSIDTFELHANGWHFAAGHVAKLELLGADAPYGRPSNGAFSIAVQRLELRLPVRECLDASCRAPAASPTRRLRLALALRCSRRGLIARVTAKGGRIRRAAFFVGGRPAGTVRRAPFARVVLRRQRHRRRVRVTARVLLTSGRRASASRGVRVCVRRRGL